MQKQGMRILFGILMLGLGIQVQASDKSTTIFPAEGNKQCNDYSANSVVLQMSENSLAATGTLSGDENPNDADTTGESATYTITDGITAGFSNATTPIDYALLKTGRSVTVIIYPSGGVTEDNNMQLVVDGVPQTIASISLCYGLGNQAPPPPPPPEPKIIPSCESLNTTGGFDGLEITCPSDTTKRSIVVNLELDKKFYNTDETLLACVCNNGGPLLECDPEAVAGEENACTLLEPKLMPTEVTTHIELNNDPYICTTFGGYRYCYSY